jgi:hypothetical protein
LHLLHVELDVPRDRERAWLRSMREQSAALAHEPAAVCFRLWRELDAPGRFLWLETWLRAEDARKSASIHRTGGTRVEEFDLLDMAWGRDSEAFMRPGTHADHIRAGVGPGMWEAWRPYARNFVSVMARQPGMIAHEMLRCFADSESFVALRTLVSREAARVGPEFDPPEEVRLATEPADTRRVYEGGPPPIYRTLELVRATWATRGRAACDRFMYDLEPV